MIKPNELRLGNWVLVHGGKYKIWGLHPYYPILGPEFGTEEITYKDLEPIKINPNLFERLGLDYTIKSDVRGVTFHLNFEDCITPPLRSIHHLQNIYHAITGDELNIRFWVKY